MRKIQTAQKDILVKVTLLPPHPQFLVILCRDNILKLIFVYSFRHFIHIQPLMFKKVDWSQILEHLELSGDVNEDRRYLCSSYSTLLNCCAVLSHFMQLLEVKCLFLSFGFVVDSFSVTHPTLISMHLLGMDTNQ